LQKWLHGERVATRPEISGKGRRKEEYCVSEGYCHKGRSGAEAKVVSQKDGCWSKRGRVSRGVGGVRRGRIGPLGW
jgi:hypothetical protein